MIESGLKSFRLPQELLQRLGVRAKEDNTSSSKIIVQAVTQFLDGPNGPKRGSVISPELIEWGHQICDDLLEDMKKLLSPEPALSANVETEKTETPDIRTQSYSVITEEVPSEVKEKASRGACKECGGVNNSHFKSCTKRKK
jgi:hypothetical protein